MAMNGPAHGAPTRQPALTNILATAVPFIDALDARGVPYRTWLAKAGLPTELEDPLQRVDSHRIVRFAHQVSYAEGIMELGMLAALRGPRTVLHPRILSKIENSPTLLTALRAVRELVYLQGSSVRIWLDLRPHELRVCHGTLSPTAQAGADFFEILRTVRLVSVIERFLGRGWRPCRVDLVMTRLRDPLFRDWLGVGKIRTGAPCGVIPVPLARLGDSMVADDGRTAAVGATDGGTPSWTIRLGALEAAMASRLGRDVPTIDVAAEMVGVGARTLQRRLADAGTSYRELLLHLRFREARRLLLDTDMTLREVAARVGYSDTSNFVRAFRRVGGLGPSEMRARS